MKCPELSGSPSLPMFLAMAIEQTDRGYYGAMYAYAVAYQACHDFTMAANNTMKNIMDKSGGAPIASMSEGGLSVSFAQGATGGSDLLSTKYGRMLLALRRSRPRMGVNAGGFIR
jgi:hypothetical protein